jgi:predicted  nucleic acid-binding Zn-ribbon protein
MIDASVIVPLVFAVIFAVVSGLTGWVISDMRQRMSALERDKASRTDLEALRVEVRAVANTGHSIEVHIATIKEQMARVASDMESEKRTRSETNRGLVERLSNIEERIMHKIEDLQRYGRRRGDDWENDRDG